MHWPLEMAPHHHFQRHLMVVLDLNHNLYVHGYLLAVLRPESALAMAEQNQFIWWLAPKWKRVATFPVTMINHCVMFPDRGDFFNLLHC